MVRKGFPTAGPAAHDILCSQALDCSWKQKENDGQGCHQKLSEGCQPLQVVTSVSSKAVKANGLADISDQTE